MRHVVTGSQMKRIDRYAIDTVGIPSLVLMERAALAVAEAVMGEASEEDRIWVACGTGNNGADGIAAARMLWLRGYKAILILAGDPERGTPEYRLQLEIARNLGMDVFPFKDFLPGGCEVLVDALFGVGLSRNVEGEFRECMELLAEQKTARVFAVDVPSGISSDTGAVMGAAVRADVTVSFGYEKLGTMLYPGRDYAGRVLVQDIGFPEMALKETMPEASALEADDLSWIPERPAWSNKGSFGKVLVIAGSGDMCGAAYLCSLAAYRTGAGLVKIMAPGSNRTALHGLLPEAVLASYDPEKAMEYPEEFETFVREQCGWAGVIVLGPGLGRGDCAARLVELVLTHAYVPVVVDADGLNILAGCPRLARYYTENIIVTPHLGEMARLTGVGVNELRKDLVGAARDYSSRYGITCVLKDAATVTAGRDGRIWINASGNSAMAKAGSGDVLSGMIAGLLALGLEDIRSAPLGVYLHGLAGDLVRARSGAHGLLARELADAIPEAMSGKRPDRRWEDERIQQSLCED